MCVACCLTFLLIRSISTWDVADESSAFDFSPDEFRQPLEANEPPAQSLGFDPTTGCYFRKREGVAFYGFGRDSCVRVPKNMKVTEPFLSFLNTKVEVFRPPDFALTQNVTEMTLEGHINLKRIMPDTFKYNTKLVNLSLSFNFNLKFLYPHSLRGLISLQNLFMVKNGFNKLFSVTPSLSPIQVPNLRRLSLNNNNIEIIYENDFAPLLGSNLRVLNLVLCRIDYLHPKFLAPLKELMVLRIGENNINSTTIKRVVENIVELALPLQLLDLTLFGYRIKVPKDLLEVIAKSNITNLSLARNHFEVLSSDSFPYMPNLHVLDLSRISVLEVKDDTFKNLPNLKKLILARNKLYTMQKGMLFPNLEYLDLEDNSGDRYLPSYFNVHNGTFSNMSKLLYLNLNSNSILHLYNKSFQGLDKLEVLGLKNASIYYIPNFTFSNLRNLKILNLEGNLFVKYEYSKGITCNLFAGLGRLQTLYLGGCEIYIFSSNCNPFVHLTSLLHLDLQRNNISHIPSYIFNPLRNLTSINLSLNFIKVWHEPIFPTNSLLRKIDLSFNKLNTFTASMLDDFHTVADINMFKNAFDCSCPTVSTVNRWMRRNHKNLKEFNSMVKTAHCLTNSLYVPEYLTSVQKGDIDCDFIILIYVPVGLLLVCCFILGLLIYNYRWHLKYWIFLTRLYLARNGRIKPREKNKTGNTNYFYDAFVSYSNEDSKFVIKLIAMLEHTEPYLRLCVYERDFQIGSVISESVLESLTKSRKTLLVLSENYAKSQWCRWESQIAEHHRLFFESYDGEPIDDSLVLVKLGPVNKNNLTPTLRYLMKTRIYLEWESDSRKQKMFWERLKHTLAPPRCYVETTHM